MKPRNEDRLHRLHILKRRFLAKLALAWHWKYRLHICRKKYTEFERSLEMFEATSVLDGTAGWRRNESVLWLDSKKVKEILGENRPWLEHISLDWEEDYSIRYLIRRFGYPIHGCDVYKDLMIYEINTPLPEIKLTIIINSNSMYFGSVINLELEHKLANEMQMFYYSRMPTKYSYTNIALQALYATLRDLLKPVSIRDVCLDINGQVEPKFDNNREPILASRSPMAGFGLREAAIALSEKPELWWNFLNAIAEKGNGNFIKGVERILNLLGEETDGKT